MVDCFVVCELLLAVKGLSSISLQHLFNDGTTLLERTLVGIAWGAVASQELLNGLASLEFVHGRIHLIVKLVESLLEFGLLDLIFGVDAEQESPLENWLHFFPFSIHEVVLLIFEVLLVLFDQLASHVSVIVTEWCWVQSQHLQLQLLEFSEVNFDIDVVSGITVAHQSDNTLQHINENGWRLLLKNVVNLFEHLFVDVVSEVLIAGLLLAGCIGSHTIKLSLEFADLVLKAIALLGDLASSGANVVGDLLGQARVATAKV